MNTASLLSTAVRRRLVPDRLAFLLLAALFASISSAATTVTLTSSDNPSAFGAAVTLTATIAPATASGTVTFYADAAPVGRAALSGGTATLSTTRLPSGAVQLTAYYAGDSNNAAALSNRLSHVVRSAPSNYLLPHAAPTFVSVPQAVAAGDFNGDGFPDLAITTSNPNIPFASELTILLGRGDGTFQTGMKDVQNLVNPAGVVAADFDGDGKLDLAVANWGRVSIFRGNGDGTFQTPVHYAGGGLASYRIVVADFNGDGKADLALTQSTGVDILTGNGDGTFQAPVVVAMPGIADLAAADFDGDGRTDLVTTGNYSVTFRLQKPDGTFDDPQTFGSASYGGAVAARDLNGDGIADLVVTGLSLTEFFGRSDGRIAAGTNLTCPFVTSAVALADFDGDGVTDIVLTSLGTLAILPGNSDGTFRAAISFPARTNMTGIAVADFKGDRRASVAAISSINPVFVYTGEQLGYTASGGTPQSAIPQTAFASALELTVTDVLGRPVAGLPVTFTAPTSGASSVLSATDVQTDATGVARVTATANSAIGNYTVTANSSWLSATFQLANVYGIPAHVTPYGRTPQSTLVGTAFAQPVQALVTDSGGNPLSSIAVTFAAPSSGASATLSSTSTTTDVNGIAAITATANNVPGGYSVTATAGGIAASIPLRNQSASSVTLAVSPTPPAFGRNTTLTATVSPSSVTGSVTFFDGISILGTSPVVSGTASLTTPFVQAGNRRFSALYRGDSTYAAVRSAVLTRKVSAAPSVTFSDQTVFAWGSNKGMAVGDFNGDGKVDLVSAYDSAILVNLSDGAGGFRQNYIQATAHSILVADVNGDGWQDLLYSAGSIQLQLGNGDGTFQPPIALSGTLPLAVADVDGDGIPDLFVANPSDVSILIGNGGGSYRPGGRYALDSYLDGFAIGDFNGDGAVDFAISSNSKIAVHLGDGAGAFHRTAVSYDTARSGVGLQAEDFNGDGYTDLLLTSSPQGGVMLSDGAGGFRTLSSLSVPSTVAVGDFNGDAILDLAMAGSNVTTYRGNGDGTFSSLQTYSFNSFSHLGDMVIGDFDGDGIADIAIVVDNPVHILYGRAAGMTISGSPQSAGVGTTFQQPLKVTVVSGGAPLAGVAVNFTAPSSGASASLSAATAVTDSQGVAAVFATANSTPGSYTVTASAGGLSGSFALTNLPPSVLRVNAGGSAYTDSLGNQWVMDTGFAGGWFGASSASVSGTSDPTLYQTEQYSTNVLVFHAQMAPGVYRVTLKFAETQYAAAGKRIFDIYINGVLAYPRLDIFAAAGGANRAFDLPLAVAAADGQVDIKLVAITGNAKANAIEIASISSGEFALSASPVMQKAAPGTNTAFAISLAGLNGFNSAVTLALGSLPSGLTATFNPASITGTGTTTLTVSVAASAAPGTYWIPISGSGGGLSHVSGVALTVPAPSFVPPASQTYLVTNLAGGRLAPTSVRAALIQVPILPGAAAATDPSGNLYFASSGDRTLSNVVYKLDTNGVLTRVGGIGKSTALAEGVAAVTTGIAWIEALAADGSGNVYVGMPGRIRKIGADGIVNTIAGNGTPGYAGDGGPAANAQIGNASGMAVDGTGALYFVDGPRIRRIAVNGTITTIAGTGTPGFSGDGGPAASAQINPTGGIAVDGGGNIYFPDVNRIRKIAATGTIATIAGNGTSGTSGDGGPAPNAQLQDPTSIAVDGAGDIFVTVSAYSRIRKITPAGTIVAVAGNAAGTDAGDGGAATAAFLWQVAGIAADVSGNLYILQSGDSRIRKVTPSGQISSVSGAPLLDGSPAPFASLRNPSGVVKDSAGNLYISDTYNNRVLRVAPDGAVATVADLSSPAGLAIDAMGNLLIAERGNLRIVRLDRNGDLSTLAGDQLFAGSHPADNDALYGPYAMDVDASGNIYIADGCVVRKLSPDRTLTTVAGGATGCGSALGDGGSPAAASFESAQGVAVDSTGALYVADASRVRKIANGMVTTIAGGPLRGFSGDGGPAANAVLGDVTAVRLDASGNLFLYDSQNFRIRRIDTQGIMTSIAGTNNGPVYPGDGGPATAVAISGAGLYVDPSGDIYAGSSQDIVRKLTPTGGRPVLTVVSSHAGVWGAGQQGSYQLTVANASGAGATNGTVTVTDYLPSGVTLVSMAGSGWSCTGASCTRSDSLPASSAYPDITATVKVDLNPPSQATNRVAVSGGGATLAGGDDLTLISGPALLQVVSVSPSSGVGSGSQNFTFTFFDPAKAADLASVQMIFGGSRVFAGSCYIWVKPATGEVWLDNDGDTAWLGSIVLGRSGVLQNSSCSIDVGASSATASGTGYSLSLAITQKKQGTNSIFGYASSSGGLNSGWKMLGSWVIAPPAGPTPVSVTPATGTGSAQSFHFTFSDGAGATDLASVQMIFGPTQAFAHSCYVWVKPSTGQIWLDNDANTDWSAAMVLGNIGTLQNSQCAVDVGASSGAASGNNYSVTVAITFQRAYSGSMSVYGYASSAGGANSAWRNLGIWNVPFVSSARPQSVSPASGSGLSQTFKFVFADDAGPADIASEQIIFGTSAAARNSCYLSITPVSGAISLDSDDDSGWGSHLILGDTGTLQNGQCSVNVGASSAATPGTHEVTLAMTFKSAYAGAKNIYASATTKGGANSGWQTVGTWTVPAPATPPLGAVSATPATGSGTSQIFTFSFADPAGASDLASVQMIFGTSTTFRNTCYVWVKPSTGQVWVDNDLDSGWSTDIVLGRAGTLQNSQCSVNGGASSATASGASYSVTLAITFNSAYAGAKNLYASATTNGSVSSGWQTLGTWTVPSPANPPLGPVSVTPASGSGTSQSFTFVFSDPAGAGDLASAQMIFGTSATYRNTCYVWVKPSTGQVWVDNDLDSGWSNDIVLGRAGTLQNSQCAVNVANSSAASSGGSYIVTLAMTFKTAYAGAKSVYGYLTTNGGQNSAWQALGTWTVSAPVVTAAQPVSVTPASGAGASQNFTFTFADPAGAADIAIEQVAFGSSTGTTGACSLSLARATGQISLYDDGGTAGAPMIIGAAGMLQNSQCAVNVGASSATSSGTNHNVTLAVAFKSVYAGAKNVYASATTNGGANSGWQALGTWTVPSPVVTPLGPVSVTPGSGSGTTQNFTFAFSDPAGSSDLASAQMIFGTSTAFRNTCYVWVKPSTGQVWLDNDIDNGWSSDIVLGRAGTLQNNQCAVNVGASSAAASGTTYTVTLAMTFNGAYAGAKNSYGYVTTNGGQNSGWQPLGTWSVPAPVVTPLGPVSVSPPSGSGLSQNFTFVFSDPAGASDLASAQMIFGTSTGFRNTCYLWVKPSTGQVWLDNDLDNGWSTDIVLGRAGAVQNSQCALNVGASSATSSGTSYSVTLAMTFKSAYTGAKSVYANVTTNGGQSSTWRALGAWTVSTPIASGAQPVSVTPASGGAASQNFTFAFTDPAGASDIATELIAFGTSTGMAGTCSLSLARATGQISLYDDAGTPGSPVTLGSAATLQNNQCALDVGASSANASGNNHNLTLAMTFKNSYAGVKTIYASAITNGSVISGWQTLGAWTIPSPVTTPLGPISVNPASGAGSAQSFTFVFADPAGASDLASAQMIVGTSTSFRNTCYVWVKPATGQVWLNNDLDNGWSADIVLGRAGTLQNSQCSVNVGASSAISSGTTYTVTLALSFTVGYGGAKNSYGFIATNGGQNSGWQPLGAWTVPATVVTPLGPVSVSPVAGAGTSQPFTFVFSDPAGASDLLSAQMIFGTSTTFRNSCYVWVKPSTGQVWLDNDLDNGWSPDIVLGRAGILQNSQCAVDVGASSAAASGTNYTVTIAVSFRNAYAGTRNVYGYVATNRGVNSQWLQLGSWTAQ